MKVLNEKLEQFADAMREKLIEVSYKYGGLDSPRSCTADSFDWRSNEVASAVREHLLKEIAEWILARGSTLSQRELVDIANCAFLLCEMSKEGAI